MRWQNHSELEGRHATLSPSTPYWLRYSDDKMLRVYRENQRKAQGVRRHALAAMLIEERVRLADLPNTLNMYVNDSIGFRMTAEQPLYYSEVAFGTPDAMAYRNNVLRISDLKTGVHPAKMDQLLCYAALFCLEYQFQPLELAFELRIYQNNEILLDNPAPEEVLRVMERYVHLTKLLKSAREEDRA